MFKHVASVYDISLMMLADILDISPSTIYQKNGKLNQNLTERLLRLDILISKASLLFNGLSIAQDWFKQHQSILGCKPIEICDTFNGMNQIEDTLNQLLYHNNPQS